MGPAFGAWIKANAVRDHHLYFPRHDVASQRCCVTPQFTRAVSATRLFFDDLG
jgi:hypothetical protein